MDLARRLADRTLELVDILSVSRDEAAIARHVREVFPPGLDLRYDEEDCFLYVLGDPERAPLTILAGHLDTVPPQENIPGRLEDGIVHGLGASDMKGGVALMIELARWLAEERPPTELAVGFLFFAREELSASESPLPRLFAADPLVDRAQLVIMLEPTDCEIHAGCLGNITATLTFAGESAHSARPWTGVNAIEVALQGLGPIAALGPVEVEVGGLTFREVLSITRLNAGIADNVIPATAVAGLNFRYAPGRTPAEAAARLLELAGGAGRLEVVSNSPAAHVALGPLAQRLHESTGFAVAPKQAWTPVAEFARRGLDAVNLGPGATRYAHRRDEQVEVAALVCAYGALQRFLAG